MRRAGILNDLPIRDAFRIAPRVMKYSGFQFFLARDFLPVGVVFGFDPGKVFAKFFSSLDSC